MIKSIGLSLLVTLIAFIGNAQSNRVTINPYNQSLLVGEQVRVEINVVSNGTESIIWPHFTDTVTTQIEVVSENAVDTIFADTLNRSTILGFQKQWVLTSFDSGLWVFPEQTIWIDSIPFTTEQFYFEITTIEVDTSKAFIDIIEPLDLPMTFLEYVRAYYHYGLIGYAILIVLAILAFFLGKEHVKEEGVKKVAIAPHIVALGRLHQLEEEQLWQKGAYKAYHIQVSDIMREYIENRFQIPVKESTTDEIKHLLKTTRVDKTIRKEIIDSLKISDLVKFAKAIPLAQENEKCLETAYHIVKISKIEPSESIENQDNE